MQAVTCPICGGSQNPDVLNTLVSQGHRFTACAYCATTLEITTESRENGVVVVNTGVTLDAVMGMNPIDLRKSMVRAMSLEAFKTFANDCMPQISPREIHGPFPHENLQSGSKQFLMLQLIAWTERRGPQALNMLKRFYHKFLVEHSIAVAV